MNPSVFTLLSTLKQCLDQVKANARAKKIKEQSVEIKEKNFKHQRKVSFLRSLLPDVNGLVGF